MPTPSASNTTGINTWTGSFLKRLYAERLMDARNIEARPFTHNFFNKLPRLTVGGSEGNLMPHATTSRITQGNQSAQGRHIREKLPAPRTLTGGQLVFVPRYMYWTARAQAI